jgi:predicted TIM-barrel fold metal-dependent hydrolase
VAAAPKTGGTPRAIVVDAHAHLFARPGDPHYPPADDAPYVPEKPTTHEDLIACMDHAKVDVAVLVQAEPYGDDHRLVERAIQAEPGRLRVACRFFPGRPGAEQGMRALVERHPGKVVAARIHAYAPERMPPFDSGGVRSFWKTAAELDLAVQIHLEPRYAARFTALIREFATTAVVVDHLGWASLPNVHIKLANLPRRTEYPHRDVAPFVAKVLEAFGPARVLWGGEFGGAGSAPTVYRAGFERATGFLDRLNRDERAMVQGGAAARVFRLKGLSEALHERRG